MPKKSERGVAESLLRFACVPGVESSWLTKAWFNIDPEGVSFSFDTGGAVSLVLFGLLWKKLDGIRKTISNRGERTARLEGQITATK